MTLITTYNGVHLEATIGTDNISFSINLYKKIHFLVCWLNLLVYILCLFTNLFFILFFYLDIVFLSGENKFDFSSNEKCFNN